MSVYFNSDNKLYGDMTDCLYSDSAGVKHHISSIWGTKNSNVVKLWEKKMDDPCIDDSYAVGSNTELNYWYYNLDETNNTVTLTRFNGNIENVITYSSYELNGKVYRAKIVNVGGTNGLFYNRNYIKTVAFGNNVDFSDMTNTNYMFKGCSALTTIDFGSNFDTSNVTNMTYMFNSCKMLKSLDLSSFDTGNVTSMKEMFSNCDVLESINVSNFNTENVTNMDNMFNKCPLLTDINVESFDTHNVETMSGIFSDIGMERIDISKWDTGKVKNMSAMFSNSINLTYVDMNNLDLSSVIIFNNMFSNCSSLKGINLENTRLKTTTLNRGESFKMAFMFDGCSSLESLDLTSWDTSKVTDMQQMFCRCSNLKTIYVDQNLWKTAYTSTNMFSGCGTNTVTYK